MKALLVKDGTVERIELEDRGDSGAGHIHELIGDGFGSAFYVPGSGKGRQVVGWCDDSFLVKTGADRPAWNVFLCDQSLYRGGYVVGGPIVIVGHDGPESVDMTELEMAAFRIASDRRWFGNAHGSGVVSLPVLRFVPGYDVIRR